MLQEPLFATSMFRKRAPSGYVASSFLFCGIASLIEALFLTGRRSPWIARGSRRSIVGWPKRWRFSFSARGSWFLLARGGWFHLARSPVLARCWRSVLWARRPISATWLSKFLCVCLCLSGCSLRVTESCQPVSFLPCCSDPSGS